MNVESRPLRYFVAVAEELNFARAAERLGIAAPALSRAIALLEAHLGVRLLERTTRRVALTAAGATLLEDARLALAALDAAGARARRAGAGSRGRLVLAIKADAEGGLLEEMLTAYARESGALPVEVVFTDWGDQAALVRSGKADVAIALDPFETAGLDTETLLREPQLLAVSVEHEFASRPSLRMAELAEGYQQVGPGAHIYVSDGAERPHFTDATQMLRHIELGQMLALLPRSFAERSRRPQLTWVCVTDAPRATFSVAWQERSRSQPVAAFVRVAMEIANRHEAIRSTSGG